MTGDGYRVAHRKQIFATDDGSGTGNVDDAGNGNG
jgi:hypothetical protein